MDPVFFASPADLRSWFDTHHETASELLVGYYKKGSGKPSVTWPESVDEALCVGWIDGIRRRIDDVSYSIRFTPRQARSTWSAVNLGRVEELSRLGRMRPAGLAAFERRADARTGIYSYEQRGEAKLDPADEELFRADATAWEYFESQPAGYRQTAIWWVVSAKKEETRRRRLAKLIEDSAQCRPIDALARRPQR